MLTLQPQHVTLNQTARDKNHALQILADILTEDALTTPDYLAGLQTRETQSATYLGQGIAIPHGTPASRTAIIDTGVRLVQFPDGVVWDNNNHRVYLAVVIAAKSDEHLQVLQLLTKALSQSQGDNVENDIKHATTPEQIIGILMGKPLPLFLHENLIRTQVASNDIDEVIYQAGQLLKAQKKVGSGFTSSLDFQQAVHLSDKHWAVVSDTAVLEPAVSVVQLSKPMTLDFLADSFLKDNLLENSQGQNPPMQLDTLVCIANHPRLEPTALASFLDTLLTHNTLPEHATAKDLAHTIGAEITPDWQRQSVVLANAHGLHARPATALVKVCQPLEGEILVAADDSPYVSAKSLTKLLSLGATYGQTLHFMAEPNTSAAAQLDMVIQAVTSGLGETVQPISQTITPTLQSPPTSQSTSVFHPLIESLSQNTAPDFASFLQASDTLLPLENDQAYPAVIASSGYAVGEAFVKRKLQFNFSELAHDKTLEKQQLDQAISAVKADLATLIDTASSQNIKDIFTAHIAIMDDPEVQSEVNARIDTGLSAPMAWSRYIDQTATAQSQLKNSLLAERADDLRDIGNKVLMKLCHVTAATVPEHPYILVMAGIVPSDVASLDKSRVIGILTAVGGASSHSAIMARTLGIPTLVGAGEAILQIADSSQILLNAETGYFYVNPNRERVATTLAEKAQYEALQATAQADCLMPAVTLDNHAVEVAVNIANVHDTAKAVTLGAEAVGLLRTELVFMSHHVAPDDAMQQQDYDTVFEALQGRPLVVRTLDVGGDKPLPYLPMPHEENPFLGLRGIRLSLRRPDMLKEQLTALLKSASKTPNRPLRIMFPMIGRIEEWHSAKAILDSVRADIPGDFHQQNSLEVGIMVEVPAAALLAPILAKEVDFFSVGTNDLTQYTLAIDRGHPVLSAEADGLHPSVLMLIDQTVKAAHAHGKWVGVCGELASDSKAVPILVGLGVDELSVSATRIPMLKAQIRTLNFQHCQQIAQKALQCGTATDVRGL